MILTNSKIANIVAITLAIIENRKLRGVENILVEINLVTTTLIFLITDNSQNKARFKVILYSDGVIMSELLGDNDFDSLVFYPDHLHKADIVMNIVEGIMCDYE